MGIEKISGIYKITNKTNGKIYVGQSIDIYKRWRQHLKQVRKGSTSKFYNALRKYKEDNFEFEIIERCDQSIINDREIYWISQLNSFEEGYNLTLGGEGSKGKVYSTEEKEKNRAKSIGRNKPILQINREGKLVKEWFSCKEMSKKTDFLFSNIHDCLKLKDGYRFGYGFIWVYKDEYEKYGINLDLYVNDNHLHPTNKIYQINNNNKLVKIWEDIFQIIENNNKYKISSIYSSCGNCRKTAYDFVWVYEKDYSENINYKENFIKLRTNKKVFQYDKFGVLINTYQSVVIASEITNIGKTAIGACARGLQNSAGGFIWKYEPIVLLS